VASRFSVAEADLDELSLDRVSCLLTLWTKRGERLMWRRSKESQILGELRVAQGTIGGILVGQFQFALVFTGSSVFMVTKRTSTMFLPCYTAAYPTGIILCHPS
jgi:hypothetical protein